MHLTNSLCNLSIFGENVDFYHINLTILSIYDLRDWSWNDWHSRSFCLSFKLSYSSKKSIILKMILIWFENHDLLPMSGWCMFPFKQPSKRASRAISRRWFPNFYWIENHPRYRLRNHSNWGDFSGGFSGFYWDFISNI